MSLPLPRYLPHDNDEWERKLGRILIDVGEPAPRGQAGKMIGYRSAEDDLDRLRGIPVVGSVGGAIPGTRPDHHRRT